MEVVALGQRQGDRGWLQQQQEHRHHQQQYEPKPWSRPTSATSTKGRPTTTASTPSTTFIPATLTSTPSRAPGSRAPTPRPPSSSEKASNCQPAGLPRAQKQRSRSTSPRLPSQRKRSHTIASWNGPPPAAATRRPATAAASMPHGTGRRNRSDSTSSHATTATTIAGSGVRARSVSSSPAANRRQVTTQSSPGSHGLNGSGGTSASNANGTASILELPRNILTRTLPANVRRLWTRKSAVRPAADPATAATEQREEAADQASRKPDTGDNSKKQKQRQQSRQQSREPSTRTRAFTLASSRDLARSTAASIASVSPGVSASTSSAGYSLCSSSFSPTSSAPSPSSPATAEPQRRQPRIALAPEAPPVSARAKYISYIDTTCGRVPDVVQLGSRAAGRIVSQVSAEDVAATEKRLLVLNDRGLLVSDSSTQEPLLYLPLRHLRHVSLNVGATGKLDTVAVVEARPQPFQQPVYRAHALAFKGAAAARTFHQAATDRIQSSVARRTAPAEGDVSRVGAEDSMPSTPAAAPTRNTRDKDNSPCTSSPRTSTTATPVDSSSTIAFGAMTSALPREGQKHVRSVSLRSNPVYLPHKAKPAWIERF